MRKLKLFLAACALMAGSMTVSAEISNGDYYIQNVSSGLYLCGANSWGTQASVAPEGALFTLTLNDGKYSILHTGVTVANKYLGANYYTDSTNPGWTIEEVEGETGVYTIKTGDNYLAQTETKGVYTGYVAEGVTEVTDAAKWYILTKDEAIAKLAANATMESPLPATFLIKNPGFNRNISTASWTMDASNKNLSGGADNNRCAESYHAVFTLTQTITGVPNGVYELTAQGFYRQDGLDNDNLPYFYLNSGKQTFPVRTGSEDSMTKASESFISGSYTISPIRVTVTDGTITLGAKNESNTSLWCIFDNFQLTYYGVDLTAYEQTITELRATLNELLEGDAPMNGTVKSNAQSVYTETASVTQAQTPMETAITNLNNAIAAFNASVANYAAVKVYLDKIATLDAAGQAAFAADATGSDVKSSYESATFDALTVEQISALDAAVIAAAKAQTTDGADMTLALVNPGFELGNTTGWTVGSSNDTGARSTSNATYAMANSEGNWLFNTWSKGLPITQTVTGLPEGFYRITVVAARDAGTVFLLANDSREAIIVENKSTGVEGSIKVAVVDGTLTLGAVGASGSDYVAEGGDWYKVDNFRLTFVTNTMTDEEAEALLATVPTGKMNAGVQTTLNNAKTAFEASKTIGNYNTLASAIAAAQASVDAYTAAAAALTLANTNLNSTNVYTAEARTAFSNAITTAQSAYDDNSMTTETAAALNATLNRANWGTSPAPLASDYMGSAWTSTVGFEKNFWSWEGDAEGTSGMTVPFIQAYVGDAYKLADNTITGAMTGLDNGLYSVSVFMRAFNNKTAEDDTGYEGISLQVNDGTAVDFADATEYTDGFAKTITAEGLVKDGNLNIKVNISNTNASWLSFKNVTYTKVRDLTAEEAAVVPADLAIAATTTVFKGKTVTLTPTSTTEGASIDGYVTWTSDNNDVATVDANGVVTGVAYGTANITATSTLNAEATATCAVTVTAPTYDQLENLDFAEGPVATTNVVTYDKDKGTGKAQMQEVTGWTIANNGDARAAAVMAYNSGLGLGSASGNAVPTEGPDGSNSNALGVEAVWKADVQYTQDVLFTPGIYTIIAYVYNQAGAGGMSENLIGFIEDGGTKHFATTTNYTVGEWTKDVISFTLTENTYGKLSVGYNASQSGNGIGNGSSPHLWIDRLDIESIPTADADDYSALNAAIDAKDGKTLGFQKDEYAPYNNVAVLTALNAAKAIDQTILNTKSTVTAATAALNDAVWTANTEEVNAIYDGTFAAAENNGAPAGWTMSNNTIGGGTNSRAFVGDDRLSEFNSTKSAFYIRFDGTGSNRGSMYYYGNTEGYTMPLATDTYYRITVDFAGWNSTNKPLRLNVTGPEGFNAVSQDLTEEHKADTEEDYTPQQFNIVFKTSSTAGNYVISFQTPGSDSNTHRSVISNLKLFTEPESSVTLAVSDAKYGTFIAPFAVEIPEGVTAYTVSAVDGNTLTMEEVSTSIAANTPVVLYSESAVSKEVKGYSLAIQDAYTSGLLTGVYTDQKVPVGSFVLLNKSAGVGFYKVIEGSEPTINANHAYLTVSSSTRSAYLFGDNTTTSIAAIQSLLDGEATIYNTNGVQMPKLQKGMNIIKMKDGKTRKVVVK